MMRIHTVFTISKIDNGWLLTIEVPGLEDQVHYGPSLDMIFSYIRMHTGEGEQK